MIYAILGSTDGDMKQEHESVRKWPQSLRLWTMFYLVVYIKKYDCIPGRHSSNVNHQWKWLQTGFSVKHMRLIDNLLFQVYLMSFFNVFVCFYIVSVLSTQLLIYLASVLCNCLKMSCMLTIYIFILIRNMLIYMHLYNTCAWK